MKIIYFFFFSTGNSITSEDSNSETTRLVLVFFIGGCTYAEISALRFLSQQEDCKECFNSYIFFAYCMYAAILSSNLLNKLFFF